MTREEPSLETLWLQNIETIDKVQRIDRSFNTCLKVDELFAVDQYDGFQCSEF
jgi:hypothetical protein